MFSPNLTMSRADGSDRVRSDDNSPTTACAPLPDDSEPDLGGTAQVAVHVAQDPVMVHRPAFWRRKSEEEFLKATVVCASKSTTSAGCREGSLGGEPLSPKPSCLKRSPSAPQRPPHSSGLHPLRSKSVAGCNYRRAVRFDSKPPAAAFTHSRKDYDRTPIESTQGRGGDLDVSLPPRCASRESHDDEDDEADGANEAPSGSAVGGASGDDDTVNSAVGAKSQEAPSLGAGSNMTLSPDGAAAIEPSTPSTAGLFSYSAATSTSASSGASSVFDEESSSSASSSTGSGGGGRSHAAPTSGLSNHGKHAAGPLAALMGLDSGTPSSSSCSPALAAVLDATTVGSSNKFSAGVPCSTEVERAMLRRKLEFGRRWMKSFGCTIGGDEDGAATSADGADLHDDVVVTSRSLSEGSTLVSPISEVNYLSVVPLAIDSVGHSGAGTSDISVLSSTLCSSEGTLVFPSSMESDGGLRAPSPSKAGITTSPKSPGFAHPCSASAMMGKGLGPLRIPSGDDSALSRCSGSDANVLFDSAVAFSPTSLSSPARSASTSGAIPSSPSSACTSSTTTTKRKKKSTTAASSSSSDKSKASAFACRRDCLLESTMGGALDGF